ncbi:MAG: hypothetical protein JXR52_12615 [Bacteroidales bacterium]|nr:hypothetical protein [Bacteroidales bacterium]MBN2699661.1 hypothetical protein [Bacteroidales bacterium]
MISRKKVLKLGGIIFVLLFDSFFMYSQDNWSAPFSNAEIGSKHFYMISMHNGETYHARIISVDKQCVLIMTTDEITLTIPTSEVKDVTGKTYNSVASVGIGYGVPYGGLGINADVNLFRSFYLSAGTGTVDFERLLFCFGSKLYLRRGHCKWRPRIDLNYGTIGLVYALNDGSVMEDPRDFRYWSPVVGLGQQLTLGIKSSFGLDLDVHYIIDKRAYFEAVDMMTASGISFHHASYTKVTLSFGIRYCF